MTAPRSAYADRETRHREARDAAVARASRLSLLRGLVFVGAFAAFVLWDVLEGPAEAASAAVGAALVVVFFVLVSRHRAARRDEAWQEALRALSHEGLWRLDRDWEALETLDRGRWPADADALREHPWAGDLHVLGRASLAHLAGPVTSAPGRDVLARWLLAATRGSALAERQEAVRELAPALDLRLEVAALGRLAPTAWRSEVERFLEWAEDPPRLLDDRTVSFAAWVLVPLTLLLGALHAAGVAPALWVLPLIAQFVVLRRVHGRIRDDFERSAAAAGGVRRYGEQLRRIHDHGGDAPLLRRLHDVLGGEDGEDGARPGAPAHRRLEALQSALDLAESRRSMVYHVLNPFLLLDVHLARRLERWKAVSGPAVRGWVEALGEFEALSALSSLAHDHPDWTFPTVDPAADRLTARGLGHPLLRPGACVRNDVEVGPAGTFLLVTGSNMSGKSTLLRAVGTNVVLAQAGGPVCAQALRLPPVRLHTSMFVEDSLEEGVSRFMAELLRVRGIVEAARAAEEGAPPVLYLLDEILQGTNSAERRVAARAVIRHLLAEGALGAVTTHDLTLHEAEDLQASAVMRHFRESVEETEAGTRLTFDYRLREGLATTRNALRLLEAVGLGGGGALEEPA